MTRSEGIYWVEEIYYPLVHWICYENTWLDWAGL